MNQNSAVSENLLRKNSGVLALKTTPRKPTDDAYLACLLDTEGSLFVFKRQNSHGSRAWTTVLAISMGDEEAVKWVRETYGGWLNEYPPKQNDHRRRYVWRVQNDAAIEVLKIMYPYLKVKKRQAALAFKLREAMKQDLADGTQRAALRDELMMKIRRLNRPWLGSVETERAAPETGEVPVQALAVMQG